VREDFDAACAKDPDAYLDDSASAVLKSYTKVARTEPTTIEGLLAKLAFIGEVKTCTPDAFDDDVVLSTLATDAQKLMAA
jgi:hypothetical protein